MKDVSDLMIDVKTNKAEKKIVDELNSFTREQIQAQNVKLDTIENNTETLEHYTERYMPIQIQNMIIENMRYIHDEEIIGRLTGEENKLYSRL